MNAGSTPRRRRGRAGGGRRPPPPALGRRGGGWVAAQLALIALIGLSALVGGGWPAVAARAGDAIGVVLLVLGAALLGAGALALGSALTPFPAPRRGEELRVAGVYARARHPIYGGGILVALGWSLLVASLVGLGLTVMLALLFEAKSRREEAWLEQHHPAYSAYRRRTRRRFVPFVW